MLLARFSLGDGDPRAEDGHTDRNQIAALSNQLQYAIGQEGAAFSNFYSVLDTGVARHSVDVTEFASTLANFSRGTQTGARGVVNGLANAGYSTITLGFGDRIQVTEVDDFDRYYGHDTIAGATQVFGEIAIGVGTGGLANVSKAGRLANVGRAALAFDVAGNAVGAGRGVIDASQNGLSLGNSVQILGGAAGLSGNYLGATRDVFAPSGNRVVSQSTESFSAVTGRATPIPLHDATAPWYRYVTPRYEGKISVVTAGRTPKEIARTYSHELQHVSDFVNHPQITQLAARKSYFPGTGLARYAIEARGYYAGGSLASPLTPLGSFSSAQKAYLGYDAIIFGVGGSAAAYNVYDTYFNGD